MQCGSNFFAIYFWRCRAYASPGPNLTHAVHANQYGVLVPVLVKCRGQECMPECDSVIFNAKRRSSFPAICVFSSARLLPEAKRTIIICKKHSQAVGKRKVLNERALKEIRLPEEGELLGRVIKLLGSDQVMVKCSDGITRRGRIRGKLKRRIWIRDNDIVIIAPWDFKNSERGDIIWRFTLPQVDWLKNNDHLARDF